LNGNNAQASLVLVLIIFIITGRQWWLQRQASKKAARYLADRDFNSMDRTSDRGVAILESMVYSDQVLHASCDVYSKFVKDQCSSRIKSLQDKLSNLQSTVEKLKNTKDNKKEEEEENVTDGTLFEDGTSGILSCAKLDEQALKALENLKRNMTGKLDVLAASEIKKLKSECSQKRKEVEAVMNDLSTITTNEDVQEATSESVIMSKLQRCVQVAKSEHCTSLSDQFQARIDDMNWIRVYISELDEITNALDVTKNQMLSKNVVDWNGLNEHSIEDEVRVRFSKFDGLRKSTVNKLKEFKAMEDARAQCAYFGSIIRKSSLDSMIESAKEMNNEAQSLTREQVVYQLKSSVWRWKKVEELKAMYSKLHVPYIENGGLISPSSSSSSQFLIRDESTLNPEIVDELIHSSPRQTSSSGGAGSMIVLSSTQRTSTITQRMMSYQDQEATLSTWLSSNSSSSSSTSPSTEDSKGYIQQALTIVKDIQDKEHKDLEVIAGWAAHRQNSIQEREQIDSSGKSIKSSVDTMSSRFVDSINAMQKENQKAAMEDLVRMDKKAAMEEANKELKTRQDIAQKRIDRSWNILQEGLILTVSLFCVIAALPMITDIVKPYVNLFRSLINDADSSSVSSSGSLFDVKRVYVILARFSHVLTVFKSLLVFLFLSLTVGRTPALSMGLFYELYRANVLSILMSGIPFLIGFALVQVIVWFYLVRNPAIHALRLLEGEPAKEFLKIYSEKKYLEDKRDRIANKNTHEVEAELEDGNLNVSINNHNHLQQHHQHQYMFWFIICCLSGIISAVFGIGLEIVQVFVTSIYKSM